MVRSESKHWRNLKDRKCVDSHLLLESNSKLTKGQFGIEIFQLASGGSGVSEIRKEHQTAQNAAVCAVSPIDSSNMLVFICKLLPCSGPKELLLMIPHQEQTKTERKMSSRLQL